MSNSIDREFGYRALLRFAAPTICMMVLVSLYTIVDGIFIARFVNTDALSATNIVFPIVNFFIGVAVMLSTGGSAVIAKKMGEGNIKDARSNFSLVVITGIVIGISLGALVFINMDKLIYFLGASDILYPYCRDYISIMLLGTPLLVLQVMFESLWVTAGKPHLGFFFIALAGVTNAVLDYVLIVPCDLGVAGAAYATVAGYCISGLSGIVYFLLRRTPLYFARPHFDGKMLLKSCANGSSEMVTTVSSCIITYLFNIIMMQYVGEKGVAAITIVLYSQFLFTALFLGFSIGVAPVFSFNYGSKNTAQLQRLLKICTHFIMIASVVITALSMLLAKPVVAVFAGEDLFTYELAARGFVLFAVSYLFTGYNIFASALFTSLSNGRISALLSFLRTFVFIVVALYILPLIFDVDGVFLAVPAAEILSIILSVFVVQRYRKVYHY